MLWQRLWLLVEVCAAHEPATILVFCFSRFTSLLILVEDNVVELDLILQVPLGPVQLPYPLLLREHVADLGNRRFEITCLVQSIDVFATLRTRSSLAALSNGCINRNEV